VRSACPERQKRASRSIDRRAARVTRATPSRFRRSASGRHERSRSLVMARNFICLIVSASGASPLRSFDLLPYLGRSLCASRITIMSRTGRNAEPLRKSGKCECGQVMAKCSSNYRYALGERLPCRSSISAVALTTTTTTTTRTMAAVLARYEFSRERRSPPTVYADSRKVK